MRRPGSEHHVVFTGATQNSQPATAEIRSNKWLRPPLQWIAHRAIHEVVATVPVLDHYTADRTLRLFEPKPNDYIGTVYNLMFAIEEAIQHPKTQIIERGLGELAIAALEIQIPYIKDGLILPRK